MTSKKPEKVVAIKLTENQAKTIYEFLFADMEATSVANDCRQIRNVLLKLRKAGVVMIPESSLVSESELTG